MAYNYTVERDRIFTADGINMLLGIRDRVQQLLKISGAVRLQEAIAESSGDSWLMLACIDHMVERGEIREISAASVPGQHRVFVSAK